MSTACGRCKRPIRLLPTRDGRSMVFDRQPVPLWMDRQRTGWVVARVGHRGRTVLAAVPVLTVADRDLAPGGSVFRPHECALVPAA